MNTSLQEIQITVPKYIYSMVRILENAALKCHTSIVHNSGKARQSNFRQHTSNTVTRLTRFCLNCRPVILLKTLGEIQSGVQGKYFLKYTF